MTDHSEHAKHFGWHDLGNGPERTIATDGLAPFCRWCLFHGHGDAKKILAFLTEFVPTANERVDAAIQAARRKPA